MKKQTSEKRLSVGITGLDEVIGGGLIPQRSYLVRGGPGISAIAAGQLSAGFCRRAHFFGDSRNGRTAARRIGTGYCVGD